jgi:parallel beta-helix repeat protein
MTMIKIVVSIATIVMAVACTKPKATTDFYITDYGAVGDSTTLNTTAIQKAIDACATQGGGRVIFPAGKFTSGTLVLRSNINYHFINGAMLIGSASLENYNKPEGQSNVMLIAYQQPSAEEAGLRVFLDGSNVTNVSFTGHGIIDGNGKHFWDAEFKALERPEPWINFRNARNVSIKELTLQNAPSHVVRFANSEKIVIDGIKINNVPKSPNTDGIDLVDTKNVHISNSFISTGDDAICLKTDKTGVENVTVTNCIIESDDAALKFGTGSKGYTRYCTFSNNVIRNSRYGISLFMLEGGVFEHNLFSNMIMSGGSRHANEYPIFIDVDKKRPDDDYGLVRNNTFSDLTIVTSGKILITGRPEIPIESLFMRNISFALQNEADFMEAKKPRGNKNFPKLESSLDRAPVPAHLTFGHINGLHLDNITMTYQDKSTRKDIDLLEVKNLKVSNCKGNDLYKLK